jgi:predicted metal-binding protein
LLRTGSSSLSSACHFQKLITCTKVYKLFEIRRNSKFAMIFELKRIVNGQNISIEYVEKDEWKAIIKALPKFTPNWVSKAEL